MIIWYSEEEPQTGNWLNEGFWELVTSVGFPCSSKDHNCVSLSSVDGVKPCLFPASLILASGLSAHLAFSRTCLCFMPRLSFAYCSSLSLSHHCDHNTMTTSCCSSLIPLSHWTTNLGNTWIDCQPARVVKATLKLQLWKLVKIRTLSTAGTQCWVPFLDLHTCQDEENKRWGQGSQRTWGAAIKKHSNKWNDFKYQPFHYSQK